MSSPEAVDFVHAVPPPLNTLILQFAGPIASLRWLLDVVSWKKGHRVQSWLLLASWWACCILGPFVVKYILPVFFILPFILVVSPKSQSTSELSTEVTFHNALSNLISIQKALCWPYYTLPRLPSSIFLRVLAVTLPSYWIVSHLLGARLIVAILGSVLLCSRAQWARTVTNLLWGSAWFRTSLAYIWAAISRQPRPSRKPSIKVVSHAAANNTTELRLLFTLFENQRWWMGLDWTAALLPAERPSWSTSALQPVAPPASFTLPEPTTSYIPHPSKPKFRIQRKAIWRWEDLEWKVVTNRNDHVSPPPSRIQRTSKSSSSPSSETAPSDGGKEMTNYDSSRRLRDRLKEKMSEQKPNYDKGSHDEERESVFQPEDEQRRRSQNSGEWYTDADGWVYGDNKWEHTSDRGGMGKYTRFRRWTRIAVLREETEEVGPGFTGVVRSQPAQTIVSTDVPQQVTLNKEPTSALPSPNSPSETGGTASDRLRQRLQAAMRRESSSS